MKTKIIVLCLILVQSIFAQNHDHFRSYEKDIAAMVERILLVRVGDSIFEQTTKVSIDYIHGNIANQFVVVHSKSIFLCTIPIHLSQLPDSQIVDIMVHQRTIRIVELHYFVFWDVAYSKNSVTKEFAMKELIFALMVFILLVFGLMGGFCKALTHCSIMEYSLLPVVWKIDAKDKTDWITIFAISLIFSIIGTLFRSFILLEPIMGLFNPGNVFIGYLIYNICFFGIWYGIAKIYQKVYPDCIEKIIKNKED